MATNSKQKVIKDDFVHTIGEGDDATEIRLPSLSYLKPGLVRRIRRLGDVDAMYTLVEMSVTPEQQEVLDEMDPDDWSAMLELWREHSGLSLGESSASTR